MARLLQHLKWRHIVLCGIVGATLGAGLVALSLGDMTPMGIQESVGLPRYSTGRRPFRHSAVREPVARYGVAEWRGVGFGTVRTMLFFSSFALMPAVYLLWVRSFKDRWPEPPASARVETRWWALAEVGCASVIASLVWRCCAPEPNPPPWVIVVLAGYFCGVCLWPFVVVWRWWMERKYPEMRRRYPLGWCGRCGYDLRYGAVAACPECGEPVYEENEESAPGANHTSQHPG